MLTGCSIISAEGAAIVIMKSDSIMILVISSYNLFFPLLLLQLLQARLPTLVSVMQDTLWSMHQ